MRFPGAIFEIGFGSATRIGNLKPPGAALAVPSVGEDAGQAESAEAAVVEAGVAAIVFAVAAVLAFGCATRHRFLQWWSDPSITADGLQYHVQILQGTPPATAGPCVLFIDPLGRPLSPVSVAGVRRRELRRDRRRL
jgi:hypothetical protein